MERIIRPYNSPNADPPGAGALARPVPMPLPASVAASAYAGPTHAPKTAGDFVRSIRRRAWLVLAVALTIGLGGAALVVRMPAVYQATAQIKISPPQFNPALTVIIDSAANISRDNNQQYVLNQIAMIRSKALVEKVVRDLGPEAGPGDVASGVVGGLTTRQIPGTNIYDVILESRDADRIARLLNAVIRELRSRAKNESVDTIRESARLAGDSLSKMKERLKSLNKDIESLLENRPELAVDGRNRLEDEVLEARSVLLAKKVRFDDLSHERRIAEMWPKYRLQQSAASQADGDLAQLAQMKKTAERQLRELKHSVRPERFGSDPTARYLVGRIQQINEELSRLGREPEAQAAPDLGPMHLSRAADELRQTAQDFQAIQERLAESTPHHQALLARLKQREQIEELIVETEQRLSKFEMVSGTQDEPVQEIQLATDPMAPVRPNRPMYIVLISVLGLVLGLGLACVLESLDHSVKVPEQLTAGLGLPLFGVVPRMRRLPAMERGGLLWTPGAPTSLEADAFRNLRASLLGAETPEAPIVTLLITSAKTGEGKSTTALNLAATCARAGERTILVDCDLRSPALAEAFGSDNALGLVDVLQGVMPWQQAVVRSEENPNLCFLPAGDLTGVPIEILGSLELRQLVVALAGHFHRVILDGPAVLGMADCRMLGQVVDATLFVVRSGAHEIVPLRRAKEMLEQSRVRIAGVVFNGLSDDLDNWSSPGVSRHLAIESTAASRGLAAPQPVGAAD